MEILSARLLSELLLVLTAVISGVLVILALLLLDLCPCLRRHRLRRAGSSSGGDVATNLLSLRQTNGL